MTQHDTLTRFSRDMDGSMEPDENGSWVRFEDAQAALSATQPAQAAQGAGEVVAWQHQKPIEGPTGEIEGYTDWMDGDGSPWWPRRVLYTHPTPPPAQPAPVVPDVDALADKIAAMLHGTYHCLRVWEAWQIGTMSEDDFEPVDESDTPREVAEAIAAMLAATPTPPAQAAADARDASLAAIHHRLTRGGPIDSHTISTIVAECERALPALATHQQGGSNV